VLVVPVTVATLHQAGAVILLTVMLVLLHRVTTTPRRRFETQPVLDATTP
jgi:heme A synthase